MRVLVVVVVLVVLASVAGWWFAFYDPARQQSAALEAETSTLIASEGQLINQRQQLLELQQRAPELRRSLDRLDQFIPPDPAQESFLDLLQLAGNAAGINFTSLSFTDPAAVVGAPPTTNPELILGSITVLGTVDSGYFQLVDFLRRLEVAVPRAVLVEQVDITEAADGFPEVSTTFRAQMFALIPAPPVPVVPDEGTDPVPPTPGPSPTPSPAPTAFVPADPDTGEPVQDPADAVISQTG